MKKLGIIVSLIALTLVFIGCQRRPPISQVERLELVNFSPSMMYIPGQSAEYTNVSVRVFLTGEDEPITLTLGDAALSITGDKAIDGNTLSLNTSTPGIKTFYVSYSGLTVSVTYNVSGIFNAQSEEWFLDLEEAITSANSLIGRVELHVYPGDYEIGKSNCRGFSNQWCAMEISRSDLSLIGYNYDASPVANVESIQARLIPSPNGANTVLSGPTLYYIGPTAENLILQGLRFDDLTAEQYHAFTNGLSGADNATGNKVFEVSANNFSFQHIHVGAHRWNRPGFELMLTNWLESILIHSENVQHFKIQNSVIEGVLSVNNGVGVDPTIGKEHRLITSNYVKEVQFLGDYKYPGFWLEKATGEVTLLGNTMHYLETQGYDLDYIDNAKFAEWIENNTFVNGAIYFVYTGLGNQPYSSVIHNPWQFDLRGITANMDRFINLEWISWTSDWLLYTNHIHNRHSSLWNAEDRLDYFQVVVKGLDEDDPNYVPDGTYALNYLIELFSD